MERNEIYVLKELAKGVREEVDSDGVRRLSAPADTHKVIPLSQLDGLARKQRRSANDFTFTDMENIREVIEKIPTKYCGYLLFLQTFVDWNDGTLVNKDGEPMTFDDMAKTLGLGKTAFYEFYNAMIDSDILFADKKRYTINRRYHFRGKTDNTNVVKSFTAKVRELYDEVNAKDLGLVYKLLPFVHFETNTICINPYENDVNKIEPFTKELIAEMTEFTEKSIYTKMRKLRFGDQYVFAEVIHGNKRFYKINPFVFYRKNGVPDATLREIFCIRANYGNKRKAS